MGKYYEDQFFIDDYFANGTSSTESCSERGSQSSRSNSQSSESASESVSNGNRRGRSGNANASSDGNRRGRSGNANASSDSSSDSSADPNDDSSSNRSNNRNSNNGNSNNRNSNNGKDGKEGRGGKDKPKPPKPPYFNSEYARLVNIGAGQTSISDGAPLIFTDVVDNNGEFIKFKPNTGTIILQDNGIYLAIYESQVYSTEPKACNHSLGLHLDLDGNHIEGSGTLARVGANEKAELVSHAIITTSKGEPNILQLLNQSGKNINAFGANLTLLKIGEIRDK